MHFRPAAPNPPEVLCYRIPGMGNGVPISLEKAVFLADAHLNRDDHHTRGFVALAEKAAAEDVPLFLLGDVFDLWFGAPELTFRFQKPVIDRLRELVRAGLRLYYVEGNRDFYLKKHHEGSTFLAVAEEEMRAEVGGRSVFLSHGDSVNRADLRYRFWKALSKNSLAHGAISRLPADLVLPLADRLERTLKRTNPRFRGSFPEEKSRAYAVERFDSGTDFVIVGHFHAERISRFPRKGREGILAVLPSWKEGWRYFLIDPDGNYGFRSFRRGAALL